MADLEKKEKELISRMVQLTNKVKIAKNEYEFRLNQIEEEASKIACRQNIVKKRADAKRLCEIFAAMAIALIGSSVIFAILKFYPIASIMSLVGAFGCGVYSDIKLKEKKEYNYKLYEIIELDKVYQDVLTEYKQIRQECISEFKEIESEMKKLNKAKDVLKTISPYIGASKRNREAESKNEIVK